LRAIIGGFGLARRMFAVPALKQFVREETLPGSYAIGSPSALCYNVNIV
jgi:hypothetical protein